MVDSPYDFGRIAAANALSDIYAMGGEPLSALNLVAFPLERLGVEVLLGILRGGQDVITAASATVLGGHSIDDPEPKYGLAVTGTIDPDALISNAGGRLGDALVLTKPLGVGAIAAVTRATGLGQSVGGGRVLSASCSRRGAGLALASADHARPGLPAPAHRRARADQVGYHVTPEAAMEAVIFDVDGTLVDSERDGHRVAFNLAFTEAGLHVRWDPARYGELLEITGGQRRIATYLREEGASDAEAQTMAERLHRRKTDIFTEMASAGEIKPRPGVDELIVELVAGGVRLAVATTGTADWVHPLLHRWFGTSFEVVVTRAEAPALKPDPSAYRLALSRLAVPAAHAVAIEDSRNGQQAAVAARLPCVVVVNDYTDGQDLRDAALILDGFGEPTRPARVLADQWAVSPPGRLDCATLRRVRALTGAE